MRMASRLRRARTVASRSGAYDVEAVVADEAGEHQARPGGRRRRRATSGALTATSAAKPAAHAFCTISTRARPLTNRPSRGRRGPARPARAAARRPPCRRRCGGRRPRGATMHVAVGDRTRPRRGPRRSREQALAVERPGRHRGQHVERRTARVGRQRREAAGSSSSWSLPHQPQLDDVVPSRGVGAGARPPVSTVTTLNSRRHRACRRRSSARRVTGRAGEQPLGEAEADRQLVVVARRAHRGRHERAVELDRHRLLDDQVVGRPRDGGRSVVADRDPADDQPLRSGPCHHPEANPPPKAGNA